MSLHYLLDGYNILHQIPKLLDKDVGQQRMILVRDIERFRPQGAGRNQVTLVFDGRPGPVNPIQSTVVSVKFSMDDSADDRIRELVQKSANARLCMVVTDDRALQYSVRAVGAKVLSVKEFLNRMSETGTRSSKSSTKQLTQREVDRINQELESRWLNSDDSAAES